MKKTAMLAVCLMGSGIFLGVNADEYCGSTGRPGPRDWEKAQKVFDGSERRTSVERPVKESPSPRENYFDRTTSRANGPIEVSAPKKSQGDSGKLDRKTLGYVAIGTLLAGALTILGTLALAVISGGAFWVLFGLSAATLLTGIGLEAYLQTTGGNPVGGKGRPRRDRDLPRGGRLREI